MLEEHDFCVIVDLQNLVTLQTLSKKHPLTTTLYHMLGLNGSAEDVIKAFKKDGKLLAMYRQYGDVGITHAVDPGWELLDEGIWNEMPRSEKLQELKTMYTESISCE